MALDYASTFGDLGRLIARIDSYDVLGETTLPADLSVLLVQFGVRWLPTEGVAHQYESMRNQVTGWRRTLAGYADRRLLDQALVLDPLALSPGAGLDTVLDALAAQMVRDAQNVKACLCAAATPAYAPANRGNGRVWTTTVLDGYNAPLSDGAAYVRYDGVPSELCVPAETMTLDCVGDSVIDGLSEGAESFAWAGAPAYGPLDVRGEGSGPGPGLTVATAGDNLLAGSGFETWSASSPSSWTVEAGTVAQSTATYQRGTSSLSAVGPQDVVRLSQPISSGLVQGRRRYFVGLSLLASAVAAGATLRAYLTDSTGLPVGGAAQLDGSSWPTAAWSQIGAFVGFPSPIPSTWKVVIDVQGLPAGVTIWLDDAVLTPAVYSGGVGVVITAGAVPWQRGDRVTFGVTNDEAGKIQSYWRRRYRQQLPSVASGTKVEAGMTLLWRMMSTTITESVLDSQVV